MTDREKLIGLICEVDDYGVDALAYSDVETIADHILANKEVKHAFELLNAEQEGRLLHPPCSVGDEVYYISFGSVFKGVCHAITQHKDSMQIHLYDYDGDNASIPAKNVFISREKAEKDLEERSRK